MQPTPERPPRSRSSRFAELPLRIFSFYIHDSRYSVPTLQLVDALDEDRARELAQARLDESMAHLAVEVREDDNRLFELTRG